MKNPKHRTSSFFFFMTPSTHETHLIKAEPNQYQTFWEKFLSAEYDHQDVKPQVISASSLSRIDQH